MIPNTMQYRGYTAAIQYEDEDGLFYGDVSDLRDTITFSGSSVEELRQAFHTVVDDYIEYCENQGKRPEKPFSGRFVVRVEPSLHRRASVAAGAQHVSLNTLIVRAIERDLATMEPGVPASGPEDPQRGDAARRGAGREFGQTPEGPGAVADRSGHDNRIVVPDPPHLG